jgi:hypothetical protein
MRQDLTAKKSFTYAGRALKAGDPFSASRADARTLCALGRAAVVGTYQTTEATSSVTKEVAKVPPAPAAVANKPAAKRVDAKKSAPQKADDK